MKVGSPPALKVPFFRPEIGEAEIAEVEAVLRSGWLTTGPRVARLEAEMAKRVGARHAIALSSGTAALHLAVEALGLGPGQAALVPTVTFAATAAVVLHQGARPILVDCDPATFEIDLGDAERKLAAAKEPVVGLLPVDVGGWMVDPERVAAFARRHGVWVVEDAAHAFPAAWRSGPEAPWRQAGEGTADVTCFSFYANKTITTGEGGLAATDDEQLAERMRLMSLHGLSKDAWKRYSEGGSWDYRIVAPGFKYNLPDVLAAIGLHQLERAEQMRRSREAVALRYLDAFADLAALELPPTSPDRVLSWHLFPIRLRLDRLAIDRDRFIVELGERGIGTSVHWRPLHLHPYYVEEYGARPDDCPIATATWTRLVSLPIFSGMSEAELTAVVDAVRDLCERHGR